MGERKATMITRVIQVSSMLKTMKNIQLEGYSLVNEIYSIIEGYLPSNAHS